MVDWLFLLQNFGLVIFSHSVNVDGVVVLFEGGRDT